MTWRELEYGVMVDRTSLGLGYLLYATTALRSTAETSRANAEKAYPDFPAAIQIRVVTRTEWEDLPDPLREHVGGCNDRCDGDSHYLKGDPA